MIRTQDKLAAVPDMSTRELRSEWLGLYKTPAPPFTADLLRRGVAWRLQEHAHGGYARETLRAIGRSSDKAKTARAAPLRIKPGTRLVRDWGGTTHHVLVLDDGYLYQEQRFASLSHIARHITGARWSGPRFFGLRLEKGDA
jgi:hypothetical protein